MLDDYLNFFLIYGYFPKRSKSTIAFNRYDFNYDDYNIDKLGKIASDLFLKNIDALYRKNAMHLVSLSGGFDSRAILAGLLKFTEAKNIYSFSFGTVGTLDYEISRDIAQKIGINHISFDMQNYSYDLNDLIYQSTAVNKQTFLFHNPPLQIIDRLFNGFTVWSGIVGDVVAGSAIPKNENQEIGMAVRRYLESKKYVCDYNIRNQENFNNLIFFNSFHKDIKVSIDEQLILLERYENFYKPHVCPGNFTYNEPFINCRYTDFMLNAPKAYRRTFKLYHSMLMHLDSNLFDLPSKNNAGKGLKSNKCTVLLNKVVSKIKYKVGLDKIPSNTNYFNFDIKLKNDKMFFELISELISDLNNRNLLISLDVKKIFNDYINGKIRSNIIKTLASLEVHLKNGKTLPMREQDIC